MTGPAAAAHPGLAGGPAYLDYTATTPVDPRVTEAMLPHLAQFFGNPSSSHHYAGAPRQALAAARFRVAALPGQPGARWCGRGPWWCWPCGHGRRDRPADRVRRNTASAASARIQPVTQTASRSAAVVAAPEPDALTDGYGGDGR
jgi:hypothetical protein